MYLLERCSYLCDSIQNFSSAVPPLPGTTPTLKKIYDVYMASDGHFAAGEQGDAAKTPKPQNARNDGE